MKLSKLTINLDPLRLEAKARIDNLAAKTVVALTRLSPIYDIKLREAQRVLIEGERITETTLSPEAGLRNIGVSELASLIVIKAKASDDKLAQLEIQRQLSRFAIDQANTPLAINGAVDQFSILAQAYSS